MTDIENLELSISSLNVYPIEPNIIKDMLRLLKNIELKYKKVSRVELPVILPPVLDVCCGVRGMWFNKHDERALYLDKRNETHYLQYPSGNYTEKIEPDIVGDFTDIKQPDNSFYLVVFDPPHIEQEEPTGRICKKYGILKGEWREMLRKGFVECFRVLKPNGVLIFKWNECNIPIKEILPLAPQQPLFGHKSGKSMKTHWVCFMKAAV